MDINKMQIEVLKGCRAALGAINAEYDLPRAIRLLVDDYRLQKSMVQKQVDEVEHLECIVKALRENMGEKSVQVPSDKTHIVGELYRVGEYDGVPTAFVSLDRDQVRTLPSLPLYRRVALVQMEEGGK